MFNQSELQVSLHLRQNINVLLVETDMKECIVRVPCIEKHSYLMLLFQKLNFFVTFHAEILEGYSITVFLIFFTA